MSRDWAERSVTVPYAEFGNPQGLNLYDYATGNPHEPPGWGRARGGGAQSGGNGTVPFNGPANPIEAQQIALSMGLTNFTIPGFDSSGQQVYSSAPQQNGAAASCPGCTQNQAALAAEKAGLGPTRDSVKSGHYHEYGGCWKLTMCAQRCRMPWTTHKTICAWPSASLTICIPQPSAGKAGLSSEPDFCLPGGETEL